MHFPRIFVMMELWHCGEAAGNTEDWQASSSSLSKAPFANIGRLVSLPVGCNIHAIMDLPRESTGVAFALESSCAGNPSVWLCWIIAMRDLPLPYIGSPSRVYVGCDWSSATSSLTAATADAVPTSMPSSRPSAAFARECCGALSATVEPGRPNHPTVDVRHAAASFAVRGKEALSPCVTWPLPAIARALFSTECCAERAPAQVLEPSE
mmetsp:Transcript_57647/g.150182  ORF Transcript_57647/g.150182 Transcript_57647/m.150182 type:complete len:209 (+) Transcript_57647:1634-2260(+)